MFRATDTGSTNFLDTALRRWKANRLMSFTIFWIMTRSLKAIKLVRHIFMVFIFISVYWNAFLITGLFDGTGHQFWPKVSAKRPSTVFWLATEGSSGFRPKPHWFMVHVTLVHKLSCAFTMSWGNWFLLLLLSRKDVRFWIPWETLDVDGLIHVTR